MSKPKPLLILDGLDSAGVSKLKEYPELFQIYERKTSKASELESALSQAEICILRSSTNLDRSLLEKSKNLKIIGRAGIGIDNVDVEAATEFGIAVFNTPKENVNATAEHTLALIFAVLRQIPSAHSSLKSGEWNRSDFMGEELAGKTLGIVGLGRVGRALARKLATLGVKVQAYDPYIAASVFEEERLLSLDLDTLLSQSDILSFHVPLTDETRNFIGEKEFEKMKNGVFLINTARGEILEERAFLKALRSQKIKRAALDVFAKEPPVFPNALIEHPSVILSPHLGAQTREARAKIGLGIAERLIRYFREGVLEDCLNPQVLEGRKND